jgi:phosphoglycerol transferase MdoB-like AlkP superfamily enzyme
MGAIPTSERPQRQRYSRTTLYVVYLAVFMTLAMWGFGTQFHLPLHRVTVVDLLGLFSFFDRFLVEFLFVLLAGLWLINGRRTPRLAAYLITALFMMIMLAQIVSLSRSDQFFSQLALENVNHIRLLLTGRIIAGIVGFFVVFALLPYLIERRGVRRFDRKRLVAVSLVLVVSGAWFATTSLWVPNGVRQVQARYLRMNNIRHTSPAWEFFRVVFGRQRETLARLSPEALEEARRYGFEIDPDRPYPLLRPQIYRSPPPFTRRDGTTDRPNIIIVFSEGLSARTINRHGSTYPGITPNIDDFASQAMVVENFYSHTAATYRGLHGQLCSIFPKYGGIGGWHTNYNNMPDIEYCCLSSYFRRHGYETVFFDTHRKEAAYVDELMLRLGFERIFNARELAQRYLGDAEPLRRDSLSDNQFVESFVGYLRERQSAIGRGRPFLISLYNLETHAWQKVAADGVQYGDGKNIALDTVHNWDHAFGGFWRYFQQSPYRDNTVVVLTADHAHFQEEPFVEAMRREDPTYQPVFVDRIPLMIRDPTRELPAVYDAKHVSSINFAPSLIHLLGGPNEATAFLGNSIFETDRDRLAGYGISSFDKQLYLIDQHEIHSLEHPGPYRQRLDLINDTVHALKALEMENRLWRQSLAGSTDSAGVPR